MEEDYDVDMGEVFMGRVGAGQWWMDFGKGDGTESERGFMVNSRSWAEELQECYSGGAGRLSSISVS